VSERALKGTLVAMCRIDVQQFDNALAAPGHARRWITSCLVRWAHSDAAHLASLLTSELVANAVVHAEDGPKVCVAVAEGVVEVSVFDHERRRPYLPAQGASWLDPQLLAEDGRGLLLVDALSDEWGAVRSTRGKEVWFRFALSGPGPGFPCPCGGDDPAGHALASGRHVSEHL
jgi:anti-sigma regulatory factor (Ser/Thr protein kinase)